MDAKGGNMMCKLKGWMDKGEHYGANEMLDAKGHYDAQMERADE